MNWPPEYSIKTHPRARNVTLRASLQHGLEIVVPKRFNPRDIPAILTQHKTWIEKKLIAFQAQQQIIQSENLPEKIILHAINQTWHIVYLPSKIKLQLIPRPHQELVLLGDVKNKSACKKLLIHWLKQQAKIHLTAQLNGVSQQINLPYEKITIRDQRTRWGSCTRNKSISLNYKLIFLPHELMRHIMIHELCHTIHLNHSEKFWRLVATFDQNCQQNRKKIQQSDQYIPHWAHT